MRSGERRKRHEALRAAVLPFFLSVTYLVALSYAYWESTDPTSCNHKISDGQLAYRILGLFFAQGDTWLWKSSCSPSSWLITIAFLLPLVAGASIVVTLSKPLRRRLIAGFRHTWRSPKTVAIGPALECRLLCKDIQNPANDSYEPHPSVILWSDREDEVDDLWRSGATAFRRLGELARILRVARVAQAERVVSFLEGDDDQVALALALKELCEAEGRRRFKPNWVKGKGFSLWEKAPLDVWLSSADAGLARRAMSAGRLAEGHSHVRIGVFDKGTLAARRLFQSLQIDVLADLQTQSRIHVVIHGGNVWALAIAREAAMHCATASKERPKITFFGDRADTLQDRLENEAPALSCTVEIGSIRIHVGAGADPASIREHLPEDATVHVVSINDETEALAYGLLLRRLLIDPAAFGSRGKKSGDEEIAGREARQTTPTAQPSPVYVRVADVEGFGKLLSGDQEPRTKSDGRGAQPNAGTGWARSGVHGFGALEDLVRLESIAPSRVENLAKHVHGIGYALWSANGETLKAFVERASGDRPALEQDWNDLSHEMRESNRAVARHLALKARAAGFEIVGRKDTEGFLRRFRRAIGEVLAIARHLARFAGFETVETEMEEKKEVLLPGEFTTAIGDALHATLARMEHDRWWAERALNGTVFGIEQTDTPFRLTRSKALQLHHEFVTYDGGALEHSKEIDLRQLEALPVYLQKIGEGLKPRLVIGVIGHGLARMPKTTKALEAKLDSLLGEILEYELQGGMRWQPVVLSNFAHGADRLGVAAALRVRNGPIPLWAALPLPADLYAELIERDAKSWYTTTAEKNVAARKARSEVEAFIGQVRSATVCATVPCPNGSMYDVWANEELRTEQYLRAGRLVCARSDLVIAICDPSATGSTTNSLITELEGNAFSKPEWQSSFFPNPRSRELVIVDVRNPAGTNIDAVKESLNRLARVKLRHDENTEATEIPPRQVSSSGGS